MAKLNQFDDVKLYPWHKGYNSDTLDFCNVWDVCDWCRQYHLYHPDGDTSDLVYRFTIGHYQLCYIGAMLKKGSKNNIEWSESIGSCFVHIAGCFDNCGDFSSAKLIENYLWQDSKAIARHCNSKYQNRACYNDDYFYFLTAMEAMNYLARQVLYFAKGRKVRYNRANHEEWAKTLFESLMALNYFVVDNFEFYDAVKLAMIKLVNVEFKHH